MNNTIVAGNHAADAADNIHVALRTQVTGSNNLIGPGGSGGLVNGQNGNIVGVLDSGLHLAPLGDYGGPTQIVALLAGSPAIDHGSNALAVGPDGTPLVTDQRGFARIHNGIVDIGAYEYGSSMPGDADGDGKVDFSDLVILARNYGKTVTPWTGGDANGDGKINFDDLVILARNYGKTVILPMLA